MKLNNRPFLAFLVILIILSFTYPQFKRHYLDRRTWMKATRNSIKARELNVPMENIEEYSKCLYDKFLKSYGKMENFPRRSNYTQRDKEDVFNCSIQFIILDSLKKQEAIMKKDSIINLM